MTETFLTVLAVASALLLLLPRAEPHVASKRLNGKNDIVPFIVGGDDAEPGQFPELVSIQVGYGEYQHLCGGVLIDQNWVLTAGHCLDQVDPAAISILAGVTDISNPEEGSVRTSIAAYEIHEDFDPDQGVSIGHDIALINLAEPLPLSTNIQTASLQNLPPNEGDVATVAGWGATKNEDPPVASTVLQWTKLNIVANDKCQDTLQDYATIREDQVCAASGEGVHAECKGDSGGPLISDGLVIGIVSWSRKPCGQYPGVFSSIPKHYQWIREKTGLSSL